MKEKNEKNMTKESEKIEHGTFSPLVFSAAGGMGTAATVTYKRLASLLATKHSQPYSVPWDGSDTQSVFPYSALQSPAIEVLALPLVTRLPLLVSQTLTLSPVKSWSQRIRDSSCFVLNFFLAVH